MARKLKAPIAEKYDGAYKGYSIRLVRHLGRVWVEKDGHFISWADDIASARGIIDTLTAPEVVDYLGTCECGFETTSGVAFDAHVALRCWMARAGTENAARNQESP